VRFHGLHLWLAFGLVALAAGCSKPSVPRIASAPSRSLPSRPKLGEPAPEIDSEDIDGRRFRLSDYEGKVVLLDFWGNW